MVVRRQRASKNLQIATDRFCRRRFYCNRTRRYPVVLFAPASYSYCGSGVLLPSDLEKTIMRPILIIAVAMVLATAASWATVIIAQSPTSPDPSTAHLMQLMRDATNLANATADPVD
jgi:hypothetical protein